MVYICMTRPCLSLCLAVTLLCACSSCPGRKDRHGQQSPQSKSTPSGTNVEADPCEAGDAQACHARAKELLEAGQQKEALETFLLACDADHLPACGAAGRMYMQGTGTETDYEKAHEALVRSCPPDAVGEADAGGCEDLCVMLLTGLSGKRDAEKARPACRMGCDGDRAQACARLGAIWMQGLGVEADTEKGFALAEKACKGGSELGCMNLGFYHSRGMGTPRDRQKARPLLKKACQQGHQPACNELEKLDEQP